MQQSRTTERVLDATVKEVGGTIRCSADDNTHINTQCRKPEQGCTSPTVGLLCNSLQEASTDSSTGHG